MLLVCVVRLHDLAAGLIVVVLLSAFLTKLMWHTKEISCLWQGYLGKLESETFGSSFSGVAHWVFRGCIVLGKYANQNASAVRAFSVAAAQDFSIRNGGAL